MKHQDFLELIKEKHSNDTVYILSRPKGSHTSISLNKGDDGIVYSIINDIIKYDESIFTESNRELFNFIDLLKHMYFPMVDNFSINGYLKHDFYPINDDTFHENFIITDVNLGNEKRLYAGVDEVVVGGSKFNEPEVLYIGRGSSLVENNPTLKESYGRYAICVGSNGTIKYDLED